MEQIFPYANLVAGVLVFIVGFIFHWIGQLTSVLNWEFAMKVGLQEKKMPLEYKVYEHAIAVADSILAWIYGLAAIGLFLDLPWGYKLAWFPGVILIYHSISFWFWTGNRNRDGNRLESSTMRVGWTLGNLVSGIIALLVAWYAGR